MKETILNAATFLIHFLEVVKEVLTFGGIEPQKKMYNILASIPRLISID